MLAIAAIHGDSSPHWLSAAAGNSRAVLGIAGTAVRAGAQSAIAGLWSLSDEPTVTFTQTFYQSLGQPNVNRAEALRRAQVALLKDPQFSHPRFWGPYVLVLCHTDFDGLKAYQNPIN